MPLTSDADRNITGAAGQTSPVVSPFHDKRLQVALSTQILIEAQDNNGVFRAVGAIQSLNATESRPLDRIGEVGTDAIIQITPNAKPTFELSVTRIIFDYQRLPAAFQRGFRHIHTQRIPFDIQVTDYNPYQEVASAAGGTPNVVTTRYVNCWLQNYSVAYTQDNYIISENATIWPETVFDFSTGSDPIAVGGDDASERSNNDSPLANTMAEAYLQPPEPGSAP